MTATAPPMGHTETLPQGDRGRDASREKLALSMEGLCPDELEAMASIKAAGGYISPSRVHAMYEYAMASQISREEFTAVLTKVVGRKGSVPVDVMGDGEARSIDRERGVA